MKRGANGKACARRDTSEKSWRFIPAMQPDQAWALAHRIDSEGSAVVWCGPQEQAELYHQQLGAEGLTMAPLEPA